MGSIVLSNTIELALNEYYFKNRNTFDELVEVSICCNQQFVQMVYYEQLHERSLKEQLHYELCMTNKIKNMKDATSNKNQPENLKNNKIVTMINKRLSKAISPLKEAEQDMQGVNSQSNKDTRNIQCSVKKRAKKYVFFDITSGEIVFEWGGLRDQLVFKNSKSNQVKMYELGLMVREDLIQYRNGTIYLFYAGDIMD